jgi:hypothetical protein
MGGVTANPDSAWVTQQARNLALDGRLDKVAFLIRDRDAKFSGPFDEVFRTERARVIQTPFHAPNANAFAERWVATVRSECLDWTLIRGRQHLERVLHTYVRHYNEARPHRGVGLRPPAGAEIRAQSDPRPASVRRRDVLTSKSGVPRKIRAGQTPDPISVPHRLRVPWTAKSWAGCKTRKVRSRREARGRPPGRTRR